MLQYVGLNQTTLLYHAGCLIDHHVSSQIEKAVIHAATFTALHQLDHPETSESS
jgi:hypothetical protein